MHKHLFIFILLLVSIISGCSKMGSGENKSSSESKNLDVINKESNLEDFYFKNLTISVKNEDGVVYRFISFSKKNIADISVPFSDSPYTELTVEYLNISSNANIGLSTGDSFPIADNKVALKLKSRKGSDKYYFINIHPEQNNKNKLLTLGLSFNLTGKNENFVTQSNANNIITLPYHYKALMQNLSTVQTFVSTIITSPNSISEYNVGSVFKLTNGFGVMQVISQSGLISNEIIKIEYEKALESLKAIELMEIEASYGGTLYNLVGEVATSEVMFRFPFYYDTVKQDLGNIILKKLQVSANANGFLNINEILTFDNNFELSILIKGDDDTSKYYKLKLRSLEYKDTLLLDMKILLNLGNQQFVTLPASIVNDKAVFVYPARYIEALNLDEIKGDIFSYKLSPEAKITSPIDYKLDFIRTKSSTEDTDDADDKENKDAEDDSPKTPTFSSTLIIMSETGTTKTYQVILKEDVEYFFVNSIQLKLNYNNKFYYVDGSIQGTLITFTIDNYDIDLSSIKTGSINKLTFTDGATSELSVDDQVNFSNTKVNLAITSLVGNEKIYELQLAKTLNIHNDITKIDFKIETNDGAIETKSNINGATIYIFLNDNSIDIKNPQELTLTSIFYSNFATLEYQINDKIYFKNAQATFNISSEINIEKQYHLVLKKYFEVQQIILDDNSLNIENMIEVKTINASNVNYLVASSVDAVGFSLFRLNEKGELSNTYNKAFKGLSHTNYLYSVAYVRSGNTDFLMVSTDYNNYIYSFSHQIGTMSELHSFRDPDNALYSLTSYISDYDDQYYVIGESYNQTLNATQKYSASMFSIQYNSGVFTVEQSTNPILYSEKKPNTPLIDYFNQIPIQVFETQFGKSIMQSYTTYTNDGTRDYFNEFLLNLNLEDYNFNVQKNKIYLNLTTDISLGNSALNKSSFITTPLHFKLNNNDYIIFDNKEDGEFHIYQYVSSYYLSKMKSYEYPNQGMNKASKIIYIKGKPFLITFSHNSIYMQFFKINDDLTLELLAYDKKSSFLSFVKTIDFYESNGEIYMYTGNKAGALVSLKINQNFVTP